MGTRLDFYHPSYKDYLLEYSLNEDQLHFTSHPLEAIRKCETDEERIPVFILSDHIPAGFFVLHGRDGAKEYSDNEKALLLRSFSVDRFYQGKGIAKKCMQLLPGFVTEHFPNVNEIVLGVNQRNVVAQNLYKRSGFADSGERKMGRKGELIIMNLLL